MVPLALVEALRRVRSVGPPRRRDLGALPYIEEPVLVARRAGRLPVEVNPEPTVLSPLVDWFLRGTAAALVPEIARAL